MDLADAGTEDAVGQPAGGSLEGTSTAPGGSESGQRARLERAASALRVWLERIRRIPVALAAVLWMSVVSGLILAWIWFLSREFILVRWLAVPWLALAAVPQVGQWILLSSVRELFALPERLLALRSGVGEQGARVLERIRADGDSDAGRPGFLAALREAYALHGEVGKVVATRAILHRFTGPIAIFIGPASFVANCVIIALAVLSLALVGL